MCTITLEEPFATPEFLDGPGRDLKEQARQVGSGAERLMRDLCGIGEVRIDHTRATAFDG
jgi:hypothetical protein